ncbi:MAG: NAD(P)/FAD-dependent oxidoreductase [Pedosphaera sp.]|nr:NAD(P)/FAD-dependent oxidoreductase [Pedosphaera sp.]
MQSGPKVWVVGGGAAGFFAAITCAEADSNARVTLVEKGARFLDKVRISGGGRCNVTHACFDTRELTARYPRGERALIGPFSRFQPQDTVDWFQSRGIKLKTEADGRMFPITDDSETIINCLQEAARAAAVCLRSSCGVAGVRRLEEGGFEVFLSNGETAHCDRLLLATGGCRAAVGGQLAVSLGHTLEPPVPSLFTFHVEAAWLRQLPGVSVPEVEAIVPGTTLKERGPLLVTHWGVSGPVILRLSAWGARELSDRQYRFPLRINWLPQYSDEGLAAEFSERHQQQGARQVINTPFAPLSGRLWEQLVVRAGLNSLIRWSMLTRVHRQQLIRQLTTTELEVTGKSLNKDEFVTCGGVRLNEVNVRTMESRRCPGLYFAGELLDIDGITGGFNFQSAWTTGWLAGWAMAGQPR